VRLEPTWAAATGLPHSGSRHSLASKGARDERRKGRRQQRSAQLPAHGEVQKLEQSLLKLLSDFNSGQLKAFDSLYSLEQMESVRDQQEALARKHFELGAEQDLHAPLSDDGLRIAQDNMGQLMGDLGKLSQAIGQLSCLDRMVERRAEGMRTANQFSESKVRPEPSTETDSDGPLIISRRSTVSSRHEANDRAGESTETSEYFEHIAQRPTV